MYEWRGFPSPPLGWRYSRDTMAKLDAEGRVWYPSSKDRRPRLKRYLDEMSGVLLGNVWTDITANQLPSPGAPRLPHPKTRGSPRTHHQSQLERRRRCPRSLLRLRHHRPGRAAPQPPLDRHRHYPPRHRPHQEEPLRRFRPRNQVNLRRHRRADGLAGAAQLAEEDKYQFQWWALGQVGARPSTKRRERTAALTVVSTSMTMTPGKSRQIIFSVKAGDVSVSQVRDLAGSSSAKKPRSASSFVLKNQPSPCSRRPPRLDSTSRVLSMAFAIPASKYSPSSRYLMASSRYIQCAATPHSKKLLAAAQRPRRI